MNFNVECLISDNPRQSRLSHYFVLCVYVLWFILFCECVLEVMPKNPYKDFSHLGRAQHYRQLNGIN
ncbi:Uncharacterized protein FWK35_00020667 [Aphis craccivora]|uniref:Uncharacterized protein n=1 Tax=Aphis craccivora TaxID=307492 RepID=A0A6G0XQK5_APHCR|nr:Uncharacterized protein FWK35_00020667 [Aphis craccivora]